MKDPVQVCTFESVSQVLGSADFEPVAYGSRHQALGEALGFDVSEILRAINAIPLCLRDEAHARTRTRLAKCIAEAAPAVDHFIKNDLSPMLTRLLAPGRHDVMQEFVLPCVDRVIGSTIGVPSGADPDAMISRLFSQSIGVAKRKRMNAELGALRQRLISAYPALTDDDINDRVALAILGTDALRGTLGRSIHALFSDCAAIERGHDVLRIPPCTGVPYVDREAMHDCTVAGRDYEPHTIFQGRLEALEGRGDKERLRFWGFGDHTCLGRRMSLQLWRKIAADVAAAAPTVTVTHYTLRKDDVFAIPDRFEIEVNDG